MKKGNMPVLRFVALLLLVATLITSMPAEVLPVLSANATDGAPGVVITKDQEAISEFTLFDDEKVELNAVGTNVDGMDCIWQILDPFDSNRWIDIRGAVGDTLVASYSLLGSMLNSKGEAVLRATAREQETLYASEPVTVQVSFRVEEPVPLALGGASATRSGAVFAAQADDEDDTHTIVINYLFDNNAIAFEPYGASVAKGSDFSATITSPAVVGYAPFRRVGEDYVDATTVVLDIQNVQEDITINVIYEPALVDFSVHHHLQNLLDDDYSIHYDLITTGKALTGGLVPEGLALTEAQLPGFKSLAYERLPVAADGSTVVEIRYDRNYYLVDFDNNGGYGAEPVYTRYGATVGANVPTRHGYVFGGWELVSYGGETPTAEQVSKFDISNGKTILVPDANLRYRARWITQETTYTLVFWKENANDSGYSYWGYLDGVSAMSGSLVSGEDRINEVAGIDDEGYFTFNAAKTEKNVLVEGDGSTVVNVYYTRNYYSITFKAKALCTIPEKHTHSDSCYDVICDLGHVHSDECNPQLTCTVPEHTAHTPECITCGVEAHTHGSADCDCKLTEHTHTRSCWRNIGDATNLTNAPADAEDGEIYRYRYYTYIYIKGTWYRYTSWGPSTGDIVLPACGYDAEHTHGKNCDCDKTAHTHDDSCYGDVLHTHDEACYSYSCGEDLHVHDTACLRLKCAIPVGHTHSSSCKNKNNNNTVKIVNRKYQQSLEDLWPVTDDSGVVYDDGQRWEPSSSSYYKLVLVYLSKMVPEKFTLTLNEGSYEPYTMNYYIQVLPGDPYTHTFDGYHYVLKNTIKAKYNYVTKAEDFFDITGFRQYDSDPGFSNNQIDINSGDMTVDFFYNRLDDLALEFNNNGTVLDDRTVRDIMYEAPLEQYNFVPEYPSNLEPNAYAFAGWYTSPGCFAGTEANWDTLTMPEDGLMLYAKWEPVRHTVRVFKDANMTEQIGADQSVPHDGFANAPAGPVVNGNYIFQGWFYMDEEDGKTVEKAFTFNGIPVRTDLDIYAKWSSHVSVNYTIRYVLDQTGEAVADPTYGSAIAGNNKTFDAKAGDQLYEPFRTGYYPLTNSHTITMSVDGTHEFTFRYVYVETMPYIVRYVNSETGATILEEKKVTDNSLSVVTETFMRVDGMMPDAYQKRLVLSASGEDADGDGVLDNNVITFYYHDDDVNSYYQVVHYIENISGNAYREYRSEEMIGLIGQSYTVEALTLTGFTFNKSLTKINGVVTPTQGTSVTQKLSADGMLIELYYDRNDVEYTVKYLENGTDKQLHPDKTGGGIFGQQVLEYALDLKAQGYQLVSEDLKILSLSANPAHNVIEFMYQEAVVSIKYQIVGPAGCGSLSQSSENVLAISGQPNGSVPTAAEGFLFDGWYLDPECTRRVDSALVNASDSKLIPGKDENSIWQDGTTYYANFLAEDSDLTIRTIGTADVDNPQAFLFRVTGVAGTDTEGVELTVSIIGNGSVTVTELPVGEYTVVELTDWSWRYETAAAQKQITLSYDASVNVLTYDQSRNVLQWLDGNDVSTNIFGQ